MWPDLANSGAACVPCERRICLGTRLAESSLRPPSRRQEDGEAPGETGAQRQLGSMNVGRDVTMITCVNSALYAPDASGVEIRPDAAARYTDPSSTNGQVNVSGDLTLVTCVNYTVHNCAVDGRQDEDEPRRKKPRVHSEAVDRDQNESSASGPANQSCPCCKAAACNAWRRSSTPTAMAGSTSPQEPGVAHPTTTERQGEASSKDLPSVTDQRTVGNQGDNSNSTDTTAHGITASSSAQAAPVFDSSEPRMPVGLSEIWLAGKACLKVALHRYLAKPNLSDELLATVKKVAVRVYCELCADGPPYELETVSVAAIRATFSVIERTIVCTLQKLSVFRNLVTSVQRSIKSAIKSSLKYVKKHIFGM